MDPCFFGAGGRTRTDDLLITNQLLYQLSYAGRQERVCRSRPQQNFQSSTSAEAGDLVGTVVKAIGLLARNESQTTSE